MSDIVVVGGGLVGSLLSIRLAQRKREVTLYEHRPDMRKADVSAGRSINLIATSRGLHALKTAGLRDSVLDLAVPVHGRMIHPKDDDTLVFQPYGKDRAEANYSVSRGELNWLLLDEAEKNGVRIAFQHRLTGVDATRGVLEFSNESTKETVLVEADRIIGADGAFSAVRTSLEKASPFQTRYDDLGHGYKELTIPAADDGAYCIEHNALHIWPRGNRMLMALPNRGGSFTVTLYLPQGGDGSFEGLKDPEDVMDLFRQQFADAIPLIPKLTTDFFSNPTGILGTLRCSLFHAGGKVALMGDAAHAIVPFFGQGMNCGFEDITTFIDVLDETNDWGQAIRRYSDTRKPNTDAIADMSLENFVEMSDRVGDPAFLLRKRVENRLEKELSSEYRSRYAMVVYSRIPYQIAFESGKIQSRILDRLCADIRDPSEADLEEAKHLIRQELSPFLQERGVDLSF